MKAGVKTQLVLMEKQLNSTENFPGFTTLITQGDPDGLGEEEHRARELQRQDHLHVYVQRHLMEIKRQQSRMRVKCQSRVSICMKIWSRTMVFSRSWFREKVVFYH